MQVVEAVQVVILDVPREPAEQHGDVEHRRRDPGHLLPQEPQQRCGAPGDAAHVPRRLADVRGGQLRGAGVAGGEPGAGHVAGVLDGDGAVGRGAPEECLDVERREVPGGRDVEAREQGLPRGPGLGLELRESVAAGGVPDGLESRARAARAEAELLVPGGECRRGVPRVERGEGAGEVAERGPLGRRRERRHDLADAEGGRGGLDLEEVGDGVGELGRGGAELGRQREGLEPRGHQLPLHRRHGGGRRRPLRRSRGRAALIAHLVGAEEGLSGALGGERERGE